MTIKEKIERLEKIVLALCKSEISAHLDYSWQEWADPLHSFIKEIEEENIEK